MGVTGQRGRGSVPQAWLVLGPGSPRGSRRGQRRGSAVVGQPNPPGRFLSLFLPLEIHGSVFKDASYNFSLEYICLQVQELMVKLVKQTIVRRRIFFFLGQMRLFNQI